MRIVELTAPSHWASYLINGDASGLDDEDEQAADEWIESLGYGSPADCRDEGFLHFHDAQEFAMPCDCQRYTFLIQE